MRSGSFIAFVIAGVLVVTGVVGLLPGYELGMVPFAGAGVAVLAGVVLHAVASQRHGAGPSYGDGGGHAGYSGGDTGHHHDSGFWGGDSGGGGDGGDGGGGGGGD